MANIDEKQVISQIFTGGAISDVADSLLKNDSFRYMFCMRVWGKGTEGVPTKVMGNTLIPNFLPAGNNKGHGWCKNEESGKLYLFNYNDQGFHGIYAYDILTQAITQVLLNLTDTNNVDILKFNKDYPIYHADVVADNLLYWVDGINKARKTNINRCIDKSSTGYGTTVTEDLITAYKQTTIYAPNVVYFTDLNRTSNYLYGLQFKFAVRFYYDDGEQSNVSDYSAVALPPNESYLGQDSITFDNNCINVSFETGSTEVSKIELLVKIDQATFVSCVVLNKSQLGIGDFGLYTYKFYNDGAYIAVDANKVARPYSYMPVNPLTQAFVKTAMIYGNFNEGFAPVVIDAGVDVTYTPFYLPSGTTSQLNHPIFTENLTSAHLNGSRWTSLTHFVVGFDVKKGNKFLINVTGPHPTSFTYTATLTDDATTVASAIKSFLLTRDAVGTPVISNAMISGPGDVSWDFSITGHYGDTVIAFKAYVTAVNYSTLLDNGLSLQTIKQGSTRKYGVIYYDDDGRTSLTYTTDALLTITQFETETVLGQTTPIGLQQPIHTIKIKNKPPIWAKYWSLVRTNDTDTFIQLLIQQVNTVVVANEPTYLDMVVGSLLTYQKIHPDTILQYEFQRGDRLRLISKYDPDTNIPTLYTPYFETEVLDYKAEEVIPVYANIRTSIGAQSTHVTPADGPKADYVGKNIIIEGVERTIISVDGADYVLDQFLELKNNATPDTYTVPNYTIVDHRGIVRIKNPPASYNVANLSLVEIYRPQQNLDNASYLNFFDFQNKYAILNWGTDNAAHVGNVQNQDPENPSTTPAIIKVTNGNAYVRNRAMPTNNQDPNPQVLIDQICDPNFSDFYESDLYDLGRLYPQDQAFGVVRFGSRLRFSNNYIEDTRINGLNDFDNTDRMDYNDPYGTITLLRFRKNYLFVFKQLKTAWTPIGQRIVHDNQGADLLATSDTLLNDLQYAEWEGGIGNNPESYTENGNVQYIVSVGSGVILRIAQDGSIPISTVHGFDKKIRDLLSNVSKYNLKIPGGFDRKNDDGLWSVGDYISYLFNNDFTAGDWQTVTNAYPDGTTWSVTQQPANSTATVVGNQIQITNTSVLGNDVFKFQGTTPSGDLTPIMNLCFTVVEQPNRQTGWRFNAASEYCLVSDTAWRVIDATKYCLQEHNLTINIDITESANPYSDGNFILFVDGVQFARLTGAGHYSYVIPSGSALDFQAFSERPSTGSSPIKTMQIKRNSTTIYGPTSNANNPGDPPLEYSETGVADAVYDVNVDATATALPADATGILQIDIFNDSTLNAIGYVDTSGTIPYQIPAYTSQNFTPNDGTPAEGCYVLASDVITGTPSLTWRFQFNVAQLLSLYPTAPTFVFKITGRSASAGAINGQYSLKGAAAGKMLMNGTPGTYVPGTSGTTSIGLTGFTGKATVGGADGTYGLGIGADILVFSYDVASKTMTLL